MHARPNLSSLKKYAEELKYNRFSVNMLSKNQIDEMNKARELLTEIKESDQELTTEQADDLNHIRIQAGLFCAFAIEDYAAAQTYFLEHKQLSDFFENWKVRLTQDRNNKPTLEITHIELFLAELWNYYLFSKITHVMPAIQERDEILLQFESLLQYYETLEQTNLALEAQEEQINLSKELEAKSENRTLAADETSDIAAANTFNIELAKSFLKRHYALYLHKLSFLEENVNTREELNNRALQLVGDALVIATDLQKPNPYISLDLAAAEHLASDILVFQGENDEALFAILRADAWMTLFNQLITHQLHENNSLQEKEVRKHFFNFTIRHAQGDVLTRLKRYPEALSLLEVLAVDVAEHYQNQFNEKVATTQELLGIVYENYENSTLAIEDRYEKARQHYQTALDIRAAEGLPSKTIRNNVTRIEEKILNLSSANEPTSITPVSVENVTNSEVEDIKQSVDSVAEQPVIVSSNVHSLFATSNPQVITRSDSKLVNTTSPLVDPEIVYNKPAM